MSSVVLYLYCVDGPAFRKRVACSMHTVHIIYSTINAGRNIEVCLLQLGGNRTRGVSWLLKINVLNDQIYLIGSVFLLLRFHLFQSNRYGYFHYFCIVYIYFMIIEII